MKRSVFLLIIIFTVGSKLFSEGMLRVSGKKIVDPSGSEVILKGIGLGGWLLQEGYMLHTSDFANAEFQIKEKIGNLIGEEKTKQYYEVYHENHVGVNDIGMIAEWGFNSIRIPMHYARLMEEGTPAVFKEEGFAEIDKLLDWCITNRLYLILDLHAAPGGQSDEPISDYNSSKPSLWESQTNQDMTVELWGEIARRYSEEEWIGGYDVINEPKWNLGENNIILKNLYLRITDAIREHDTNHIIYFEGNWFATDFSGLSPAWDDNMVYSFHKYWNTNDLGSIQYLLNLRNETDRPLWLGETGENSNVWFTECVELMAQHNIGWAWWPHKKIASIAGPLSAELTEEYQTLLDYWKNPLYYQVPEEDFAFNALVNQAKKLNIDSCNFQPDVIYALINQPGNDSSIPYKELNVPGTIYATDYNIGKKGTAYNDSDYENIGGGTWNHGWNYRNDGVDIENCTDTKTNGFDVGWIESGEWLRYTVNIMETGLYDLEFRIASINSNGKIIFRIEEQGVQKIINLPSTGDWKNWQSVYLYDLELSSGVATIQIQFLNGGFNINYMDIKKKSATRIENNNELPGEFNLGQNYPNPFNNQTVIQFYIPESSHMELKLYNSNGEFIEELMNGTIQSGSHSVIWNSDNFSSGVYFYRLTNSTGYEETRKAILMK